MAYAMHEASSPNPHGEKHKVIYVVLNHIKDSHRALHEVAWYFI